MGCFKELALRLQEQQEQINAVAAREDESYPSPVRQLLYRLEDWKDCLRTLIGERCGDRETQYRCRPDCLPAKDPEAFHAFPPPRDVSVDDVMRAIAALHARLELYGTVEEEPQTIPLAGGGQIAGQLSLPFAA